MESHSHIKTVKIIDCTLRDGGHLNKWNFSTDFASRVVSALSETNIHAIEVGYVSTPGSFPAETGLWRYSREEDIRAIVPADIQSKIAVMGDIGKVGIEQFKKKDESVIDIVRLAFYPGQGEDAIRLGHEVLDLGYEVYLNCMGIVGYEETELKELIRQLYNSKISNVVFADSFGSLMPWEVANLTRLFIKGTGKKIGYHAHNNLETAFANSMAAIDAGAASVDASIYGIGRGSGNLPLEVMLSYMLHSEDVHTNIIPLLELIENEFIGLRKELGWGYNLHYMISGLLKCHPNYASALLDEYKMDMPSVWATLVALSKEKPIKFNKKLLEEVVKKGEFSGSGPRKVKYAAIDTDNIRIESPTYAERHRGADFLVLGNGPSLEKNIDKIKKFIKEKNLVVIGANYLHGLVEPDYHAFNNLNRFIRYGKFIGPNSKLLIGNYISEQVIKDVTNKDFERLPYVNEEQAFGIKDGIIQSNCGTVSVLLIATAMVMGARKIYVAGLDGYKEVQGKTHFYSETQEVPTKLESASLNEICSRFLDEIRDYQVENGLEPFAIVTPTNYSKHFVRGLI